MITQSGAADEQQEWQHFTVSEELPAVGVPPPVRVFRARERPRVAGGQLRAEGGLLLRGVLLLL